MWIWVFVLFCFFLHYSVLSLICFYIISKYLLTVIISTRLLPPYSFHSLADIKYAHNLPCSRWQNYPDYLNIISSSGLKCLEYTYFFIHDLPQCVIMTPNCLNLFLVARYACYLLMTSRMTSYLMPCAKLVHEVKST